MPTSRSFSYATLLSDQNSSTLKEVALDKGLAKLGDAITNFVYSLAKSQALSSPTGEKVSGKILSTALRDSGIRQQLPARLTQHQRADAAEALVAFFWLKNKYTIEEFAHKLAKLLGPQSFSSRASEDRAATSAFTELFKEFNTFFQQQK